jgi:hypothetical protein
MAPLNIVATAITPSVIEQAQKIGRSGSCTVGPTGET